MNQLPEQPNQDCREEFLALLLPVYERLEAFAFAMTRNSDDALDLVGETVLTALEHFGQVRDPKAFLSWLFTVARRIYIRQVHRAALFTPYDATKDERLLHPDSLPDVAADVRLLYEALAKLPQLQREAVTLFELSGMSLKEIAKVQGSTVVAVKVRLARGRRRLAQLLGVPVGEATSKKNSVILSSTDHQAQTLPMQATINL